MKLYEIANDYLAFMQAIEDGEIPEEAIEDTLEAITSELEDKADNIACLMKTLIAEANAIRGEERKLAERRKVKENTYESLKAYLSNALQAAGLTKVETARNRISFRKSEAVEFVDEDAFITWAMEHGEHFLKYSTPEANKTEIKNAIKSGFVFDEASGARLVTKNNIQIK